MWSYVVLYVSCWVCEGEGPRVQADLLVRGSIKNGFIMLFIPLLRSLFSSFVDGREEQ